MQVAHQALEAFLDHMRINLGRRNIGVTEQRLHDAQIRAVMQQVRRECVTQHMRTDEARRETGCRRKFLEVAREMLPRQMSAFAR